MNEEPDVVVDARGLRCPVPVIRLAQAARNAEPGTVIEVWSTDPAAVADIPAWCRMRGQELLVSRPLGHDPSAVGPDDERAADGGTVGTAHRVRVS